MVIAGRSPALVAASLRFVPRAFDDERAASIGLAPVDADGPAGVSLPPRVDGALACSVTAQHFCRVGILDGVGHGACSHSPAPGGGLPRLCCRWAGSVKDRRRRHVCAHRASLTGSARRRHSTLRPADGAPAHFQVMGAR